VSADLTLLSVLKIQICGGKMVIGDALKFIDEIEIRFEGSVRFHRSPTKRGDSKEKDQHAENDERHEKCRCGVRKRD